MGHTTLITVRRGTESNLKNCKLESGEFGFTTDTHQLFIGSDNGNLLLAIGKPMNDTVEVQNQNPSQ